MRSFSIAGHFLWLITISGVLHAQTWQADAPTAQPSAQSTTFAGPVYRPATIARTSYDDRKQSVYIVDEPVSGATLSSAAPISGVYPASAVIPAASGTQAVYQTGQQFQLFDAPRLEGRASPVSYSTIEAPSLPPGPFIPECIDCTGEPWLWQILPQGLIYHSYLAGPKEPRLGGMLVSDVGVDTKLEGQLGGRAGLLRYGNTADFRPQGWQFDVEGGAIIRQDLTQDSDVDAYDFRIGFPLTYGWGRYQAKFAWYHASAHLGDEFFLKHPTFTRINYSRNAIVWGHSFFLTDAVRIYGEADYAYWSDGGNKPWAFQFGFEYNPVVRTWCGSPFLDMNVYLRQENNFGGPFTLETGWQWRGLEGGQLMRIGFFYQNGPSMYGEFFHDSEQLIGAGLWYDF